MNEISVLVPAPIHRAQEMKFGTELTRSGTRFRLWAPNTDAVSVHIEAIDQDFPMKSLARGWFEIELEGLGPGTLYRFRLSDGTLVPDPASRHQPQDVHGPSEVINPRAYQWKDAGWRGHPWEETVLYELHVGTFTEEGTFRAAIEKLDNLVALGVTTIELMPIADFAGRWNWGYDGVMLFAPDSTYGRPEDLKALIDAAHARSMMVMLDVVYNHFGPSGNYMNIYAPVVTDAHKTPWGPAVNVDDEGSAMIRDFITANARYWLNEYRFDGLRFDAVHEIRDNGPKHMLQELAEHLRATTDGRHIQLVLENEDNDASWLKRSDDGRRVQYTAQWSDDIHHALHTATTGESMSYYGDYANRVDLAARSLAEGFGYQGEALQHQGKPRGEPSAFLPPTAFVSFIQNHDHVGNRPLGERIHKLAPAQAVRSLAAINILSPHIPLIFMGEEWASERPFVFFSDVGEDLADTIREGHKEQKKDFPGADNAYDPMSEETFKACKLDWDTRHEPMHADILGLYRRLIEIRRREIEPRLFDLKGNSGSYELVGDRGFRVRWRLADGSILTMLVNLSPEPIEEIDVWEGRHLWLEGVADGHALGPWGVVVALREAQPEA